MRLRKWDNGLYFYEERIDDILNPNDERFKKVFKGDKWLDLCQKRGYNSFNWSVGYNKFSKEQKSLIVAKRVVSLFMDEMLKSLIYDNDTFKFGIRMQMWIRNVRRPGMATMRNCIKRLHLETSEYDYKYIGRYFSVKLTSQYKLLIEKLNDNDK